MDQLHTANKVCGGCCAISLNTVDTESSVFEILCGAFLGSFCSRYLGHMTKMAATPIYGKNPSKIFIFRTDGPISTKLGM